MDGRVVAVTALVCACVGFSGGCSSPRSVRGSASTPMQFQDKVVAKSWTLQHYVRLSNHAAERIGGGLLKAKIGLQNLKRGNIWCDIQVVFYDASGFKTEDTNWQPLCLTGSQVTFYEAVSINSEAADYSIILRDPRKGPR